MFAIMGIGPLEAAIVAVVVLLLFGHRLPGLMRSLGRGVVEFKAGLNDTGSHDDDMDDEPQPKKNINAEKS